MESIALRGGFELPEGTRFTGSVGVGIAEIEGKERIVVAVGDTGDTPQAFAMSDWSEVLVFVQHLRDLAVDAFGPQSN